MMTRETKAGLVVSGSFLCLVGIVLVSKLREAHPTDPGAGEATNGALAKAPDEPAPAAEIKAAPLAEQKAAEKNALTKKKDKQPESKVVQAVFAGEGGATNLPQSGNHGEQPSSKTNSSNAKTKLKDDAGMALDDNAPVMDDKDKGALPNRTAAPSIIVAQPTMKTQKASMLTAVPDAMKRNATSLQGMGLRQPSDTDPTTRAGQAPSGDISSSIQGAPPLPRVEPKQDARPDAAKLTKPFVLGAPVVAPAPTPASPAGSGQTGDQGSNPRSGLVGILPAPKDPGQERTSTPSLDNTPSRAPLALRSDTEQAVANPPQGVRLDAPIVPRSNQAAPPVVDEQPNRTRAPLGAPLPAVSPIAMPALPANTSPASAPQVESYDEDTYSCKANDTFRSISQAAYQTDAYDQALLLFNRNHPLANDSIKQNPPFLQPGQPIYIPPLRILRKYYAASIPDVKDPGPARSGAETPAAIQPVTLAPPVTGSAPAAASTRTYRVAASGEMIRDIARRTLGSGDRWTEIYQLNRTIDPTYAVPAGTELKLPGDARVAAQ